MVRKDPICEVIWLGDLNYRIDMTKEHYKKIIEDKENTDNAQGFSKMIDKDQLRIQKILQKNFLEQF